MVMLRQQLQPWLVHEVRVNVEELQVLWQMNAMLLATGAWAGRTGEHTRMMSGWNRRAAGATISSKTAIRAASPESPAHAI